VSEGLVSDTSGTIYTDGFDPGKCVSISTADRDGNNDGSGRTNTDKRFESYHDDTGPGGRWRTRVRSVYSLAADAGD